MTNTLDWTKYHLAFASRSIRRVAAKVQAADLAADVRAAIMKELGRAVTWQQLGAVSTSTTYDRVIEEDGENVRYEIDWAVYSDGKPVFDVIDVPDGRATIVHRPDSRPGENENDELLAEICPTCLQPPRDEPEANDGSEFQG